MSAVEVVVETEGPVAVAQSPQELAFAAVGDKLISFPLEVSEELGIAKVTVNATSGAHKASQTIEIDVSHLVPDETTAVAAYVVAVDTDGPGFVTAFECERGRPLAGTANYAPHETRGAVALTSINAAGKFCVFTHAAARPSCSS